MTLQRTLNLSRAGLSNLPILYCFPYAGGDVHIFSRWKIALHNLFDVRPVQLPARGKMLMQPALPDMATAVTYLDSCCQRPAGRKIFLFGHSMGALLAFELSRYWTKTSARGPDLLMVSAFSPPDCPRISMELHSLDDRRLLEAVFDMGGTTLDILQESELVSLILPTLRSDFALLEKHGFSVCDHIEANILAFSGTDDQMAPPENVAGWSRFTKGLFEHVSLPGGHFFINTNPEFLFDAMQRSLLRKVCTTSPLAREVQR